MDCCRRKKLDVYVPTHLYSQLVQHKDSFNLLKQQVSHYCTPANKFERGYIGVTL
ncbi:hypothetical protein DPMN_057204 [Dreissena polymorpha]|uniref:Uncharacterized protein n=1 Tax=Dreissena polymorpha TaxID=45954 RepID=A0A9D4CVS4_DREPO|nr:hypothetical protein DPMN_057204 [Dreissena polymorpha]